MQSTSPMLFATASLLLATTCLCKPLDEPQDLHQLDIQQRDDSIMEPGFCPTAIGINLDLRKAMKCISSLYFFHQFYIYMINPHFLKLTKSATFKFRLSLGHNDIQNTSRSRAYSKLNLSFYGGGVIYFFHKKTLS